MWTIIFGLSAFALAIPSWGGSLIIFFWIKNKYDNIATSQILYMAKKSIENGTIENLYKINNAAINKVYTNYGTKIYGYSIEQYLESNRLGILRTNYHIDNDIIYPIINHPEIGEIYLYLSQTYGNKINILAIKV